MKRSLLFKLILCYIITISLIFMGANTLGSYLLKEYFAMNFYNQLELTGSNIASGYVISNYFHITNPEDSKDNANKDTDTEIANNEDNSSNPWNNTIISVTTLNAYLQSISSATSFNIWLLDADGNFLYSSDNIGQKNIYDYNKRFFYMNDHNITTIKGLVDTPSIFSINKIKDLDKPSGYIVLHKPANYIETQFSEIMPFINISIALCAIIIAVMFVLIYFLTIHPINKITNYAIAATQGKINKKIDIKSNDEYRDLSNALFYLTSELNNIDEYQRKFISNISHDFRSPLTSIKGYLEAMLDGTIPPENYEKYIKTILFEAERLTDLTTNLLTLNQLDNTKQLLHKTDFDINYIINKTVDVYEGRCQKNNISIEINFESEKQFVYADQAKIQQVINNILDNAIKFSRNNSKIILSTYVKVEKVFISIKDYGQGIPKESLSHIWERFYKLDSSRGKDKKGTGLGLSITKEIINAHHENINVTSTEGVGTEFCFSLPKSKNKL